MNMVKWWDAIHNESLVLCGEQSRGWNSPLAICLNAGFADAVDNSTLITRYKGDYGASHPYNNTAMIDTVINEYDKFIQYRLNPSCCTVNSLGAEMVHGLLVYMLLCLCRGHYHFIWKV